MNKKILLVLILASIAFIALSGCTGARVCGNGICEWGESYENCKADCAPTLKGNLQVTVIDSVTGAPIQGAYVSATMIPTVPPYEPIAVGTTDASGIARFGPSVGAYMIKASIKGYDDADANAVVAPAITTYTTIALKKATTGDLIVRISDSNTPIEYQSPIQGAIVYYASKDTNVFSTATTDRFGDAMVKSLKTGTYEIKVTKDGYEEKQTEAEVKAGDTTLVKIGLMPKMCRIACTTDSQCNDNNAMTTDRCVNPGTCNAACLHITTGCGNGVCDAGETASTCPEDCGATTGNLQVTVIDSSTLKPIEGATVDLNWGGAGGLALKTKLLVKSIRIAPTTNTGLVEIQRDGGTGTAQRVLDTELYVKEIGLDVVAYKGFVKIERNGTTTKYFEGDEITDLNGAGPYAGQRMKVTFTEILQTSGTGLYQARFELFDPAGNMVTYAVVGSGTYLSQALVYDPTTITTMYKEGDEIVGLEGTGAYAGQEMTVKISNIIQTSQTGVYQARFELYDPYGMKVDAQTVGTGTYLNNVFVSSESGAIYYEGDRVFGLKGAGAYAGQEMTIEVGALVQVSTGQYNISLKLYDSNGNLVNNLPSVPPGTYLNKAFVDSKGQYALETNIYVKKVFLEPTTDKSGVELTVMRQEVTNSQGIALFKGLVPGTYTTVLKKTGYYTRTLTVRVDAGITTEKTIELSPAR